MKATLGVFHHPRCAEHPQAGQGMKRLRERKPGWTTRLTRAEAAAGYPFRRPAEVRGWVGDASVTSAAGTGEDTVEQLEDQARAAEIEREQGDQSDSRAGETKQIFHGRLLGEG